MEAVEEGLAAQLERKIHPAPGWVLARKEEGSRSRPSGILMPAEARVGMEAGVLLEAGKIEGEGRHHNPPLFDCLEEGMTIYWRDDAGLQIEDWVLLGWSSIVAWESP